jgi:hypothetical protein
MAKELKIAKSFFWILFIKCIHNYKLLFFHVYQLHVLMAWSLFENFKKFKILKFYIPN